MQNRPLPASGQRGTLGPAQPFPLVQIDRQHLRLSPGARIFDRSNRNIVHAHLPPGAEILYAAEPSGHVNRIYILTDEEVVRLRQAGRR